MSPRAPGAGVELVYEQRGAGPAVVLVHDMASDHTALAPLAAGLAADARVIAYARRGYAGSGAPEPYAGTTVAEQAEDARALLGHLGAEGAVAFGEGFGALVVLDLLVRRPGLIRAAALAEPPLYAFVPDAARALAAERGELEEALAAGGPAAGVERWLRDRTDDAGRLERARASAPAFFADYAGLATLPLSRRELRAITVPLLVLTAPATPPALLTAADALAALPPRAERAGDGDAAAALRRLLAA